MNYTWSVDSCGHSSTTSDHQTQSLLDTSATTATLYGPCTVTTLAFSIIFCVCGIVTNFVNILAFTCNSVYDDKSAFLLTIVILDLSLLIISLPYFILQTAGYAVPVGTSALGLYLTIRYALSFVLICASSWMLVAMVSKKILSTQVEDDAEIKPLGESDQNVDSTDQKRHSNFSSVILIVTILIAAILLHGVKLFEYQRSSESDDPWLMKKRLTGFEYELYTVITNIAVTMIAPYMFLLISTAHYMAKVVRVMMRKKSEREPNRDIWLLFLLGLLHLVCYGPSLYQQMFLLFTKTASSANICLDNFNSTLIILNASVKIVLFKLFTNHIKRYKLPLSDLSSFLAKRNLSLKRGDVVRNFNYSFSNPSYEQDREQPNPSYEQDRKQHNPSYEQDREQHNPSYEQDREQHNPSYEQNREQHKPSYEQDREQHNMSYEQDREQHNMSYEQDREQQNSDL